MLPTMPVELLINLSGRTPCNAIIIMIWSRFGRLTGRTPCTAYNFNDLVAIWSLNLFGDVPHAMLMILMIWSRFDRCLVANSMIWSLLN